MTLELRDGRRMGLGLSRERSTAEQVAAKFSDLVGAPIKKASGPGPQAEGRKGSTAAAI